MQRFQIYGLLDVSHIYCLQLCHFFMKLDQTAIYLGSTGLHRVGSGNLVAAIDYM